MSELNTIFENRAFTPRLAGRNGEYTVNSMTWAAVGGCKEASISKAGGKLSLWDAINMLRLPVEIYEDRLGMATWWGYVHEAQVRMGALEVAVSLDSMVNRCAVAYSYVAPGDQTVGERKTTAWADDLDSQGEFGIKELLSSAEGMSDAAAEARRAAILAGQKWPQGGISQFGNVRGRVRYSGAKKSMSATLLCHGWWDTLGWQYYANTGTDSVATTDQIAAIVTAEGQFLTATLVDAASGVSCSEYQDGDSTALKVIEGLLAAGGASGRRLLASVDIQRRVNIFEEPAASSCGLWMDEAAKVYESGGRAAVETQPPVAGWVRLRDIIPGVVDLTKLVDPSLQFIEGSGWSTSGGAKYTFKGKPSIESVLAVSG